MNRESSSEYINDEKKNLEMTAAPPALTFPEGGLHGWLAVAGGYVPLDNPFLNLDARRVPNSRFLTLFCAAGTMQSFGVYENYYTLNSLSEHPPSDIAWIGSVQGFLLFGGGFFSGQLFDLGYFRLLLSGGSFLFVFS